MEQCSDSGQKGQSFAIVFVRIPVFENIKITADFQKAISEILRIELSGCSSHLCNGFDSRHFTWLNSSMDPWKTGRKQMTAFEVIGRERDL
jgi:hypothetical protein